MPYSIEQVPTDLIKFFVRRARQAAAYGRLKQSIREVGLKTPIGLRDISDRPKEDRKRPSGGHYKYELIYGQGRLQAFRELGIAKIPAVVVSVGEEEIVGRFLAENVMRRKLSWREKARLIKNDVEMNGLDVDAISCRYCVTPSHAMKYLRILTGASEKTWDRAEQDDFSLAETEKLTTLPAKDQDIVIEVLDEHKLDKSALRGLVDQAHQMRGKGALTKELLSESISELNAELKKCRERYKLRKLEYALGPQHLFSLVEDPGFLQRARAHGIEISHFVKH